MRHYEADYAALVDTVLINGTKRKTRAGETLQLFGTQLVIDCMQNGYFPILTQRQIFYKGVFGELAAFLRGATELREFKELGCNYWDANAKAWVANIGRKPDDMSVGVIYGSQWRNWEGKLDQFEVLIKGLRTNPSSRRHILTTWNPSELHDMCLPPCHILAQFNVTNTGKLDCCVTMRSVDLILGLPSDVILYAALLLLVCRETGYSPGTIVFQMGDTHIYDGHILQWAAQRMNTKYVLPTWDLGECSVDSFHPRDLTLINYKHGDKIVYPFNA